MSRRLFIILFIIFSSWHDSSHRFMYRLLLDMANYLNQCSLIFSSCYHNLFLNILISDMTKLLDFYCLDDLVITTFHTLHMNMFLWTGWIGHRDLELHLFNYMTRATRLVLTFCLFSVEIPKFCIKLVGKNCRLSLT